MSSRRATVAGPPLASAPAAPAKVPARLYQAKSRVRSGPGTISASTACSVGRKRLTSPEEGLSVPATAMTRSGQNCVTPKKPAPVASMSREAPIRMRLRERRWLKRPMASVSAAEPTSVPVTMAPIRKGEKPSALR